MTTDKRDLTFWERLAKQDTLSQANLIEAVGWVGLFLFVTLFYLFWTATIDVTVPAHPKRHVDKHTIEATVVRSQASDVLKGRSVSIQMVPENGSREMRGNIRQVRHGKESLLVVIHSPESIDLNAIESMRILLPDKPLRSLFIQKSLVRDFLDY